MAFKNVIVVAFVIISITAVRSEEGGVAFVIHNMTTRGSVIQVPETESTYKDLTIFCHSGIDPGILYFWTSTVFKLKTDSEDYQVYMGRNASMVEQMFEDSQATWFYSSMPWKSKDMKINPFQKSCIGVLTADYYSIMLHIYRVNYWQVVMTVSGFLLFLYAPRLCRNAFFHYTTGISAGVLFSLLLLTYFVQRKVRASWYSWILGCYSLALYFLTSVWYNLQSYIIEHHVYVLGYFVITGAISFAVCYRLGPVENDRTLNLIQWSLQAFALLLIYLSSYYQSASLSLALVLLTWSSIPESIKSKAQVHYKRRFFKPTIKLLSEMEYMDQSRIETEKALDELREFCKSPKCKVWKTVGKLSSPSRFAEFIEGSSHLTPEEVIQYSQVDFEDDTPPSGMITDDDDGGSSVDEVDNRIDD